MEFILQQNEPAKNVLPQAMEIGATRTGSALFQLLASMFSYRVDYNCAMVPEDRIRELFAAGDSQSERDFLTGTAPARTVRRSAPSRRRWRKRLA